MRPNGVANAEDNNNQHHKNQSLPILRSHCLILSKEVFPFVCHLTSRLREQRRAGSLNGDPNGPGTLVLRLISDCVRFCRGTLLRVLSKFHGAAPVSKVAQHRIVAGVMIMTAWGTVSFTILALTFLLSR